MQPCKHTMALTNLSGNMLSRILYEPPVSSHIISKCLLWSLRLSPTTSRPIICYWQIQKEKLPLILTVPTKPVQGQLLQTASCYLFNNRQTDMTMLAGRKSPFQPPQLQRSENASDSTRATSHEIRSKTLSISSSLIEFEQIIVRDALTINVRLSEVVALQDFELRIFHHKCKEGRILIWMEGTRTYTSILPTLHRRPCCCIFVVSINSQVLDTLYSLIQDAGVLSTHSNPPISTILLRKGLFQRTVCA